MVYNYTFNENKMIKGIGSNTSIVIGGSRKLDKIFCDKFMCLISKGFWNYHKRVC